MRVLDVIFGENSASAASRALQNALRDNGMQGTLYIGYPVLATADAKVFVDALLVSRDHGIIAFDLASDVGRGRLIDNLKDAIRERQDQIYAQNPRWTFGRRGRAGLMAIFSPVLCHVVGAGALAGRAIAILSIVFGFGETFFARLPGQRLL